MRHLAERFAPDTGSHIQVPQPAQAPQAKWPARLRSDCRRATMGVASLVACLVFVAASAASGESLATDLGFTLWSPDREDNAILAKPLAGKRDGNPNCLGDNRSPALAWARAPANTRSFVLMMDDQTGRSGLGVNHWLAYDLPPTITSIAEGAASEPPTAWTAGRNTLGMDVYLGPCPPRGNAYQHYVFTLIATSVEPGTLRAGMNKAELLDALKGKALGAASAVFRYAH